MTISAPVMRRAKKEMTVSQWVTRTSAVWRGVATFKGVTVADTGAE